MQGLMPLLLSVVAGVTLFAALNHFHASRKEDKNSEHLAFSLFSFSCFILTCTLVAEYSVYNEQQFIQLLKVQTAFAALFYITQLHFLRVFFRSKEKLVFSFLVSAHVALSVISFVKPYSLFIDDFSGVDLPDVDSILGFHLVFIEPVYSVWSDVFSGLMLIQLGYVLMVCTKGVLQKPLTRNYILLSAMLGYYICMSIDAYVLVVHGVNVYFSALIFLFLVGYMSSHLTAESSFNKIEDSKEKYKHLLEELQPDCVFFTCDAEGYLTYISPSVEEVLGFSETELMNDRVVNLFDLLQVPKELLKGQSIDGVNNKEVEIDIHDKNGDTKILSLKSVFQYEDDDVVGIDGVVRDVTANVKTNNELMKFTEELESRVKERTVTLEAAMAGLKSEVEERELLEQQLQQSQKMESIGQLAGGVAHDFNNIMTAIRGFTELAFNEVRKGEDVTADLEQIHDAANRGAELTNQLLGFARKQMATPKILEPNEVLTNTIKLLPRLLPSNITIDFYPGEKPFLVEIDPVQLDQIVINMVVNARDAMPYGGTVSIRVNNVCSYDFRDKTEAEIKNHEYLQITITDSGQGIEEEQLKKIFDPFFTTKPIGKGSGLGLAVCYGVVKQHDGFIFVDSELGKGTQFTVLLPRAEAGDGEMVNRSAAKSHDLEGGDETLLVVEDDQSVAMLTEKILATAGYKILVAYNGEDALRIYRNVSHKIDLIITDVMMPKMGGAELIEAVHDIEPDAKVICLSGYADDDTLTDIRKRGVTFIQKPYTPVQLAHTVRMVLNQSQDAQVTTGAENESELTA